LQRRLHNPGQLIGFDQKAIMTVKAVDQLNVTSAPSQIKRAHGMVEEVVAVGIEAPGNSQSPMGACASRDM
jgi:hypothetical protein